MLKDAEKGFFQVVISYKSNRIGRNVLQALTNEERISCTHTASSEAFACMSAPAGPTCCPSPASGRRRTGGHWYLPGFRLKKKRPEKIKGPQKQSANAVPLICAFFVYSFRFGAYSFSSPPASWRPVFFFAENRGGRPSNFEGFSIDCAFPPVYNFPRRPEPGRFDSA